MSARAERLIAKRSLEQHRAAITKERHVFGCSEQHCFDVVFDALMNINAVVAALIDRELARPKRRTR